MTFEDSIVNLKGVIMNSEGDILGFVGRILTFEAEGNILNPESCTLT